MQKPVTMSIGSKESIGSIDERREGDCPVALSPFPYRSIKYHGSLSITVIFISLLIFFTPDLALSQASHVEITNPVYGFLQRMQVRGLAPGYSRAMLPLERKQVTALLREMPTEGLSGTERALLARFRDEFVAEDDGTQEATVLFATAPADLPAETFNDREKFLYRWRSENGTSRFFMEFLGSLEYRTLMDDDGATNVTLGQVGGRFRGTLGGTVGFGLRATNGTASGDRALALSDQQLRRNFNFSGLDKDFFDFAEAYVSATWDWGAVSLGKEKRIVGSGISNQVLLSTNAQPFDAVQVTAHVGDVRFMFLHGSLLSEVNYIDNYRPQYASKYLALHRVEADLFHGLRLGVFESVIYSEREFDFAYLNPVNFYKSAEHAGGDRDNPMLGFDAATLFLPGWQWYGSWVIDDIDFSLWGQDWWGNKFIWQGGMLNSTLLPNTDIAVEYTRIEPYVYTHRLEHNQYTNNRDALGLEIPPNSDEWFVRFRHWLSATLWLEADLQYRRHGRNELNDNGAVVVNHGGDIYESLDYVRDSETAPFLAGPLDRQTMLTLALRWEPWRNIIFHTQYRFRDINSDIDGERKDHFLSLMLLLEY